MTTARPVSAALPATVIPDSDPYPWPWNGRLDPARLCLVLAGMQRVHAEVSPAAAAVVPRIERLARSLRALGSTVCHIRHTDVRHVPPSAPDLRRPRPLLPRIGEPGWAPVIDPVDDDPVVAARGLDGFCASALDLELRARGIELVVAAGLAAEVAVSSTVRSANDRGFECLTLSDATAPLTTDTGERELRSVTMSGGIFGAVGTSDALLGALRRGPAAAIVAAESASSIHA